MKKTKVKMSRTSMYEFWYDYVKPKYKDNAKLCSMDTDSFVINIFLKTFLKTLIMMLKDGLIHLTMIKMIKDHFK